MEKEIRPKISVIIPVYNVEQYITACIESVIDQTYRDWELILIDDGSLDNSGSICDILALRDKRINVVHKVNEGVSATRNLGLKMATGDYITFIDGDDYIERDFFENAIRFVLKYNADVYISGAVEEFWKSDAIIKKNIYTNKYPQKTYTGKALLEANRHDFPTICISSPWCKLYKRVYTEDSKAVFPMEMNRGEDAWFNLMIIENCDSFVFDSGVYYHYRRENSNSLYSRYCSNLYDVFQRLYQYRKMLLERKKCSVTACEEYDFHYVSNILASISHFFQFRNKNTFHDRLEIIKRVSRDDCLKTISLSSFFAKDRVVIWLLKNRAYYPLYFLYSLRYMKKNKKRI